MFTALDNSTLDDEPSASDLQYIRYMYRGKSEELQIYKITAPKWKDIATRLGFLPAVIKTIANPGAGKEPDDCITDIFQKWLENAVALPRHNRYPKTWRGLCNLLLDSELGEAAQCLKKALYS